MPENQKIAGFGLSDPKITFTVIGTCRIQMTKYVLRHTEILQPDKKSL